MSKEIIADSNLVARCGLYCGACGAYLNGKCPGCKKNDKASWCKVRTCCADNNYKSCADCKKHEQSADCKQFNNFISKLFAAIFGSNRNACIGRIKEVGTDTYAQEMCSKKAQSIKKKEV